MRDDHQCAVHAAAPTYNEVECSCDARVKQIAAYDVNETVIEQASRELFRLTDAAFVERHVGALQNARCVAGSLTMTHEQNRHTSSITILPVASGLVC